MVTDLNTVGEKNHRFKLGMERLEERETCRIRENNVSKWFTFKKLMKQRKRSAIEHNMNTFGEQWLGIHGHELPKYHNKDKEWWKKEKDYNLSPRYASQAQML